LDQNPKIKYCTFFQNSVDLTTFFRLLKLMVLNPLILLQVQITKTFVNNRHRDKRKNIAQMIQNKL